MSTSIKKKCSGRPKDLSLDTRVLESAWALLADRSLAALTLNDIAVHANTSRPALYRRWNKVEEIVVDAFLMQVQDTVPVPRARQPPEALVEYIQSLMRFMGSRVGRTMAEVLGSAQNDPQLMERFHAGFLRPRRDHGRNLIQRGQQEGYFRTDMDCELIIDLYAGPIYFRAFARHAPLDDAFAQSLAELVLRAILIPERFGNRP